MTFLVIHPFSLSVYAERGRTFQEKMEISYQAQDQRKGSIQKLWHRDCIINSPVLFAVITQSASTRVKRSEYISHQKVFNIATFAP